MNKTAKSNSENKQASDKVKVSSCRSKIEPEEVPIIKSHPLIENLRNQIGN